MAADPNPGDTLTFRKASGPGWPKVAGNGTLSGTPYSPDAGPNSFQVRSSDPAGLADTNTVNISVVPAPAIVLTVTTAQPNVLLTWTGGIAPHDVLTTTNLAAPIWLPVRTSLSVSNVTLDATDPGTFFKIKGQ